MGIEKAQNATMGIDDYFHNIARLPPSQADIDRFMAEYGKPRHYGVAIPAMIVFDRHARNEMRITVAAKIGNILFRRSIRRASINLLQKDDVNILFDEKSVQALIIMFAIPSPTAMYVVA